ncbi:MAG: hypothetical protein QG604_238 [Candidatus Dependentiae bacterium]|nr:hypothetical protein [Candidatus Dependentiae bacterium]
MKKFYALLTVCIVLSGVHCNAGLFKKSIWGSSARTSKSRANGSGSRAGSPKPTTNTTTATPAASATSTVSTAPMPQASSGAGSASRAISRNPIKVALASAFIPGAGFALSATDRVSQLNAQKKDIDTKLAANPSKEEEVALKDQRGFAQRGRMFDAVVGVTNTLNAVRYSARNHFRPSGFVGLV